MSTLRQQAPIALSAVFIVNLRGDCLIERQYRSDITRVEIDQFKHEILNQNRNRSAQKKKQLNNRSSNSNSDWSKMEAKDVADRPPIRQIGETKFMFVRVMDVYVCAASKLNCNASMCFAFLKASVGTFQVSSFWFWVWV